MDQARGTKRYPTAQPLLVRCESWGEFVALYATDVGQGGMFIVTDEPPPVLSEVEVQLKLPEGHEIPLRARVVHVIEPSQAAHMRREPGVGIEFVGLDAAKRAQIHQLVEFARWQGTSHRPTASLASHMFEMNASARPADVMHSLPSGPAVQVTPPSALPSARAGDGETASSGVRRTSSVPQGKRRRPSSGSMPAVNSTPATANPLPPPPKPTDQTQLKIGMSHLAAKRFPDALKHLQSMLDANPGDLEVTKWLQITIARKALTTNDEATARIAYEKVLLISEDVHEARKFVRELDQRIKLSGIPFGRYFMKKKP